MIPRSRDSIRLGRRTCGQESEPSPPEPRACARGAWQRQTRRRETSLPAAQLETLIVSENEPDVSVVVFVEFPVCEAVSELGLELL